MNKKLLAILMALCSIFLISGLAACNVDDPNTSINTNNAGKYVVELDLSGFSHDVGLNREFNYESIKFRCVGLQPTNSLTNNEKFEEFIVEAKEYMVLSGGETDTLGEKEIVILYDREVYVISYTVKYQVDYLAFGEVYASQFVLSADEITTIPTPPAINGYTFANYLDSEIPAEITDNIQLDVHFYNDSLKAPALQRVESSYEPNMSIAVKDVELPSNENGEWVYVDDSVVITTAGEHLVDVEFIPANDQVAPRSDKLAINVAPKKAEFTITTSESFVYDGASHFPSYSVTDDIEVEVVGEPQVSAGTYTYALLVANSNYEGFYTGSFEITKPSVTISVSDKEMKYGEAVPAVEYTVTGFENLSILGISEVKPSVTAIGNYELTVTVSNTNVNLTINKGNLSVAKGDLLEVADPVLSTESVPAVYEDTLSVVTLTGDYRGKWAWAQPDLVINSVTSFTATAVFTPNNTNYNVIEREVTFTNIDKRTLEITVTGCNYVYSGEDYTIVYEIQEGKNLVVDGNIVQSTAGTYETVLTINDEFYKGSVKATLFIDKDVPETNFTPTFERKWSSTLTLSEIELPEGYSWNNPTTKLANIETNEYEATFTPSDTTNYYTVAGKFSVTVIKADGILHGVEESYEFIYKNQAYSLSGITSTPSDGKITYTYLLDGEKVDEILLPGTYEVIIDLAEST